MSKLQEGRLVKAQLLPLKKAKNSFQTVPLILLVLKLQFGRLVKEPPQLKPAKK